MEAMRSLQRHENVLPISSRKEIVDYITKNYNNDGDIYAQVRTSLKQLCTQGFVAEVLNDEYQLIGPFSFTRMLKNCECPRDSAKMHISTPKYSKVRRTFRKKKRRQEESRCRCEKLDENPELEDKESTIHSRDNISPSSRKNYFNNTIFATPTREFWRFTRRNNNSRKYPVTEETRKHNNHKRLISHEDQREQTVDNIQQDNDDHRTSFRRYTPKRVRKTNDNIPAASGSVQRNQETNLSPNNRINNNSQDSLFQEIENSISEKSKSREKELKKWIQRCRRECEKQKKQ
ncbi:uncharacterized protein LOC122515171 [Polistes fuscatus]|uniref:uncharacterized protein LOC122515171 n=1 Tax=Polistes fuscatus TaxID=30207 RepID=UPI001CA86F1F|nr:uncharacterized protein LOC122515171 [Polistes fuscatus]